MHAVGSALVSVYEVVPGADDPRQATLNRLLRLTSRGLEHDPIEPCGKHGASALEEVVRLIDENRDSPPIRDSQPVQQRALIEVVVVVSYDDIGPSCELLAQVVRADAMLASQLTNGGAILNGHRGCLTARLRQSVVEPTRQRA